MSLARAKVRASHVRLTYVWSTLELTKSLLIVGKTLFLGNGAGCCIGSNLRCALYSTQTKGSSIQLVTTDGSKYQERSTSVYLSPSTEKMAQAYKQARFAENTG